MTVQTKMPSRVAPIISPTMKGAVTIDIPITTNNIVGLSIGHVRASHCNKFNQRRINHPVHANCTWPTERRLYEINALLLAKVLGDCAATHTPDMKDW
jgi:hypothetical protein